MVKTEMRDAKAFSNFLSIIARFVSQGMFTIDKEKTTFYAINPSEFPSTRLELETNIMTLKEGSFFKQKKDEIAVTTVKLSFNELQKFRANLDIMETFHKMNSFEFSVDISTLASKGDQSENPPGTYVAQKLYFHEDECKINQFCVEENVVKKMVMKKLTRDLEHKISFDIDPSLLSLVQSKTANFVDLEKDGSIYIYPDNKIMKIELGARNVSFSNNVILKISDSYEGNLIDTDTPEIIIHKTGYDILNILRTNEKNGLHCKFSPKYKVLEVTSSIEDQDKKWWIKSKIITSQVKGK